MHIMCGCEHVSRVYVLCLSQMGIGLLRASEEAWDICPPRLTTHRYKEFPVVPPLPSSQPIAPTPTPNSHRSSTPRCLPLICGSPSYPAARPSPSIPFHSFFVVFLFYLRLFLPRLCVSISFLSALPRFPPLCFLSRLLLFVCFSHTSAAIILNLFTTSVMSHATGIPSTLNNLLCL